MMIENVSEWTFIRCSRILGGEGFRTERQLGRR